MDPSVYPTFQFVEHRGQVFPDIPLPADYKGLLQAFYAAEGIKKVERFASELERSLEGGFNAHDIRLQWREAEGLTNIQVGASGGLDLNRDGVFQEHNLGTLTSLIAGAIAIKYVKLLLNPYYRC